MHMKKKLVFDVSSNKERKYKDLTMVFQIQNSHCSPLIKSWLQIIKNLSIAIPSKPDQKGFNLSKKKHPWEKPIEILGSRTHQLFAIIYHRDFLSFYSQFVLGL